MFVRFKTKYLTVEAYRVEIPTQIGSSVFAKKGDWLVDINNQPYIIEDYVFKALFESA